MNAWEDAGFVAGVRASGRKKLVIAALWTEVCLVFPALAAMRDRVPWIGVAALSPIDLRQDWP